MLDQPSEDEAQPLIIFELKEVPSINLIVPGSWINVLDHIIHNEQHSHFNSDQLVKHSNTCLRFWRNFYQIYEVSYEDKVPG